MKILAVIFSVLLGFFVLSPVNLTYAATAKTQTVKAKKAKAKKVAVVKKKKSVKVKKVAVVKKKKSVKAQKVAKNGKISKRRISKAKATKQRFKLAYVYKNGKRVAVRVPAKKTSRYAVYRPSVRNKILQNRATARLAEGDKDPLSLSTGAVLAYDLDSDKVLYEKNADEPMAIASITKLMTALVIVESRVNLDQKFTVTRDDIVASSARSKLRPGAKISRRQALHLALMSSDNRAAHFLARTFPSGKAGFIREMNAKAVQLGMTDSVFYDSIGLHNGNQSSAMDLSHLIASAGEYRLIRELSTTPEAEFTIGKRVYASRNTNRFVRDPDWDVDLQKTGLTTAAGYCMVMKTNISGRNIAMIFLDAPNKSARNQDIEKLKDWLSQPGVFQTAMNQN